ncbi:hypothetical protein CISIN_1g048502mg, partial [Citrus sinensis]
IGFDIEAGNGNGRRSLMFAAATASVWSGAGIVIAMAAEEPNVGTPEAKKFYASIVVIMPCKSIFLN